MTWMAEPHAALMPPAPDALVLHLDGFDGPLDLLLDLARAQKVDLARISILALVDQYLEVIEGARRVRLELAADWLVMAAWLTWLKSRLLLPRRQRRAGGGRAGRRCAAGAAARAAGDPRRPPCGSAPAACSARTCSRAARRRN